MKTKNLLLILLILFGGFSVYAQDDTIKSLIISEVRMDDKWNAYVELTNMGTTDVDLGLFTFNSISDWMAGGFLINATSRELHLPNVMLAPNESFVITNSFDQMDYLSKIKPEKWHPYTKPEMRELADLIVECIESDLTVGEDQSNDSVSIAHDALYSFGGKGSYFLEWHNASGTDSAAVDAINCVFKADGKPFGLLTDVAGITGAPDTHVLVRKANVTKGNIDWDKSRGTDLIDSEWLPVPIGWPNVSQDYDRDPYWTIGNHGDYNLDASTLVSINPDVTIDFGAKTITVPWGMRNNDSIMHQFQRKPGVSWFYKYSTAKEDSAFTSIRNGDSLFVYVCGNDLDMAGFGLIVNEPLPGDNIALPKNRPNFTTGAYATRANPYDVTYGLSMDTIYNIPFQTRSDTLLKYLDKAPDANWEILYLNNEIRADLKKGDKLKVTAKNASVKEYFIKVNEELKSTEGKLSSITWPDIPDFYKGLFGWVGDTIPGFSEANYNYTLTVPFDYDGIPALIAKPINLNSKVVLERAKTMSGSEEDRTITITSTAPDDTSIFVYKIILVKEKDPSKVQPWAAEPFLSQFSHREQGSSGSWNSAWEIVNPGTEVIDMKNYMFVKYSGTAADVVRSATSWTGRFQKYIPGMQWADSADWAIAPGTFIPDLRIPTQLYGGDVFVMASAGPTAGYEGKHWAEDQFDVNFRSAEIGWGIGSTYNGTVIDQAWGHSTFYLFKIVGDSILDSKKPATDPNDFELIDVFGTGESSREWTYLNSGVDPPALFSLGDHKRVHFRKSNIYKGNPVPEGSFSLTNADSCEWYNYKSPDNLYQFANGSYTWALRYNCGWRLGTHELDEVTVYQSIVSSTSYLLSDGFSMTETLKGVLTGTTVDDFLSNIIKKDTGQVLTVKNSAGTIITGTTAVDDNSVLEVLSADGNNTSAYVLDVTTDGLSNNAVLTSTTYTIDHTGNTGTITGMDYSTTLATVLQNVTLPNGANLTIVNAMDEYVALKSLNNDTVYVDVTANDMVYLDVVAEDGKTTILYQLKPNSAASDAFVYSFVYDIDQVSLLINLVSGGTSVDALIKNLVPSSGATLKVLDKFGAERSSGNIYKDDLLLVTSSDGSVENVYYLGLLGDKLSTLAYVLSDLYNVDQLKKEITGDISNELSPADFMANLTPAAGASIEIVNADNVVNNGANLNKGDLVKVVAEDGVTLVYYTIDVFTVNLGINNRQSVVIYPNPTKDFAMVSGVEVGSKIRVYNALGKLINIKTANSDRENISLENQPSGIYFIKIETTGKISGNYKLMKVE